MQMGWGGVRTSCCCCCFWRCVGKGVRAVIKRVIIPAARLTTLDLQSASFEQHRCSYIRSKSTQQKCPCCCVFAYFQPSPPGMAR